MGSCASLYGRSAVKAPPQPAETVTDKFEILPSPIKHFKIHSNTEPAIKDISVISHHKTSSGSKEEAFFDSRAWLDSDCDDFFSVKGDFTPSCGSTPLNHRFPAGTPRASGGDGDGDAQLPSFNSPRLPAKRRKKLLELFRESLGSDASFAFLNSEENPPVDWANGTVDKPCVSGAPSGCSSERTAAGTAAGDETGLGSKMCCLPALVSRHSSSERKDELKASAMAVNGVS